MYSPSIKIHLNLHIKNVYMLCNERICNRCRLIHFIQPAQIEFCLSCMHGPHSKLSASSLLDGYMSAKSP